MEKLKSRSRTACLVIRLVEANKLLPEDQACPKSDPNNLLVPTGLLEMKKEV